MAPPGILNKEIFRPKTTYNNDYREPCLPCFVEDYITCTETKQERERKRILPKDFETLYDHGRPIPFTLFHRTKEIVKTNPHTMQIRYVEMKDTGLEEARKKRNAIQLPPAMNLDKLDTILNNRDAINAIRCYPYTSSYRLNHIKFYEYPSQPLEVPTTTLEKRSNTVRHKYDEVIPALPKGWASAAKEWDKRQNRADVDPTAAFWACYNPPCASSDEISPDLQGEIRELARSGELTEPFNKPVPSYGGHLPRTPRGVPLKKTHYCSHDPRASLYQANTARANAKGLC